MLMTYPSKLRTEKEQISQDYQRQLEHAEKTAEANAERVRRRTDAEIADLQSKVERLEADLEKVWWYPKYCLIDINKIQANKNHVQDLQTAHEEYTTSKAELEARLKRAEEKSKESEQRASTAHDRLATAESALNDKEKARQAAQSELDDLLMVFGDIEEKVSKYKERLKELGENVSDDEDDDDDDDEEDGGEDESGVD
jgi:chromosome segregation ATPase